MIILEFSLTKQLELSLYKLECLSNNTYMTKFYKLKLSINRLKA